MITGILAITPFLAILFIASHCAHQPASGPGHRFRQPVAITRADNLYCASSINGVADLTGHFIEHFYGASIARQVDAHFSPEVRRSFHLNRRFAQACGLTPVRYLQQLRLHHACELLRDTNLSVAEIAVEVGYQDLAYFSTLFRRRMMQTATDYRRAVRGKLFTP